MTTQSQQQDALVRELERRIAKRIEMVINRRFDELEHKLLLRGTTLVNASEACKIAGVSRTTFYAKGFDELLEHIDLPDSGRRYVSEMIVPKLAGIK